MEFDFNIPKPHIVNIPYDDINDILDYNWLFNNIPWVNHSNEIGRIVPHKTLDIFYINTPSEDENITIKKLSTDEINIIAHHGFAGNTYEFILFKDNEKIKIFNEYPILGFSKQEVKDKYITRKIKERERLHNKIDIINKEITFIKTSEL